MIHGHSIGCTGYKQSCTGQDIFMKRSAISKYFIHKLSDSSGISHAFWDTILSEGPSLKLALLSNHQELMMHIIHTAEKNDKKNDGKRGRKQCRGSETCTQLILALCTFLCHKCFPSLEIN
jgi:hypothetical protein